MNKVVCKDDLNKLSTAKRFKGQCTVPIIKMNGERERERDAVNFV